MKKIVLLSILLTSFAYQASQIDMLFDACNKNKGTACYELGLLYEEGIGFDANISQATFYFHKACELQSDEACNALDRISQ